MSNNVINTYDQLMNKAVCEARCIESLATYYHNIVKQLILELGEELTVGFTDEWDEYFYSYDSEYESEIEEIAYDLSITKYLNQYW